jgi:hypothetical protein
MEGGFFVGYTLSTITFLFIVLVRGDRRFIQIQCIVAKGKGCRRGQACQIGEEMGSFSTSRWTTPCVTRRRRW